MKKILNCTIAALIALALLAGMAFAEAPQTFLTVAEDCAVRVAPDPEGDALIDAKADAQLAFQLKAVLDENNALWYSVLCDGEDGWIAAEYAELVGTEDGYAITVENVGLIEATGGDSFIRAKADREAEIVGQLNLGEFGIYGGDSFVDYRGVRWDCIEFEGSDGVEHIGWISSMYTSPKALNAEA